MIQTLSPDHPHRQAYSRLVSAADLPGPDDFSLRVGDAERTSAIDALGEHLAAGRIDLDEYGTRTSEATTARTVGDLRALFADLPPPYPTFEYGSLPARRPGSSPVRRASSEPVVMTNARARGQRINAAAMAASVVVSVLLFFVVKNIAVFLLPVLIAVIMNATWGSDWKNPRERD